jgi:hypothetical protein
MYPEAWVMKGYSPSELGGDRQHAGSLTGEMLGGWAKMLLRAAFWFLLLLAYSELTPSHPKSCV